MADSPTDRELIRSIRAGERDALGALYDRYVDDVMAVAVKYVDDQSVAEELIHDLFLEVWSDAHDYDPDRGSVRTWLMVRMRSRALDKVRYERRRDHEQLSDVAERKEVVAEDDPAEEVEYEWIRRTVQDLPERLGTVLVYTYYHEMTGPEIAEQLEIPVGTVRSRLASARDELRQRLHKSEDGGR